MLIAVFGDSHAHAEALDAVLAAVEVSSAEQLWSLGDMVGGGPDAEHVVSRTRELCRVALVGNHDYGVTGSVDPLRFGEPGSPAVRSLELASERLTAEQLEWMRSRRPAARRDGVQCWHGGPHNAVREYVRPSNAADCLRIQRERLGLVGHTHEPAAWQQAPDGRVRRARVRAGEPLDISDGKWLLNPGAVGAPVPAARRLGWWGGLDLQASEGAFWLLLDDERRTATWQRAPFDPAPARRRARALGLDDEPRRQGVERPHV